MSSLVGTHKKATQGLEPKFQISWSRKSKPKSKGKRKTLVPKKINGDKGLSPQMFGILQF